jgi:hypothetical protein
VALSGLWVVVNVTIWYQSMVSMLILDGSDKWSLDPRFRVEMVFGGTNFKHYNVYESQGVTWPCYEA